MKLMKVINFKWIIRTIVSRAVVLGMLLPFSINAVADIESDPQRTFEQAMKHRKSGDLQTAIRAFQDVLSNRPELHRARLELAVAYLQALNFSEARKQAEQVMNAPGTPEAVKQKIQEFLVRVDLSSPKHTWTSRVSLGFIHDSNVNAGPDDSVLTAFPVSPSSIEVSDNALQLRAGVSHRYISGNNLNLANSKPAFLWLSQASIYSTNYRNEDDFDLDIISLSTGPSFIAANVWRGGVSLQLDHVELGGNSYGLFTSINPNITYILEYGKTEVTVDVFAQKRNYKRTTDTGRDSKYYAAGISMGHIVEKKGFSVQEGVRIYKENADAANFDNDGNEVFVGMNFKKSAYTNMYIRVSRNNKDFSGSTSSEKQNRYVVGFNHAFTGSVLKNWVVKANFTRTDNHSNNALADYNRSQTGISLERAF